MRFQAVSLVLAVTIASPLMAQRSSRTAAPANNAAAIRAAVSTITEADYRRRISILADDSMRGRATPSPELEETANWIAGEFQRFGLRPGGDNGTFLQRYPIRRTQLDSASNVMVMGNGVHAMWAMGRDAALGGVLGGELPPGNVEGNIVLMYGMPTDTARPFGNTDLRNAIVLHVYRPGPYIQSLLQKGREAGARGWILLSPANAQAFARQAANSMRPRVEMVAAASGGTGLPLILVRDSSALDLLRAAGENIDTLRAATNMVARPLSGFTGAFQLNRRTLEETSAPNVIGILEGSDPQLKAEYVFFTGHMDHVGTASGDQGCRARGADSICNGADDDASGTTAVVMLAQAFSRMNPRPRRSLVFMTVSGEERGLWGSEYYSEHPVVPLSQTVTDLNTDMIGRYFDNRAGWRDTIAVIGKEHSSLGATANRVTQEHPELHMQLVDDIWPTENFYFRSDHYNFARKGVPILFFFNGTHPDYHQVGDSVDKIDAEKASRIVQMVYYVGLDVANTTERPQWNPESRRRIVENATP